MEPSSRLLKSDSRKNAICLMTKRCVSVAFEFVSIGEIDMMNEKFQAEVIIESMWQLTAGTEISGEYDPRLYWNPQIYIENAHANLKEQIKHRVMKVGHDIYVTEYRLVKGNFWQRVELEDFPVDVQELSIVLTTKHGSDEIYLIADPKKISCINLDASHTFYEQQKWSLLKLVTVSEQSTYDLNKKTKRKNVNLTDILSAKYLFKPPKIVATCYSARKPGFYFLNAYFLVFLITFIAFPVFSIDIKAPHFRLATSYTILLTSVSFKWVLNNKLPSVSNFTSLDKYQISSIFFVCLLIVWHSIVGSFWDRDYGEKLDKCLLFFFGILFILKQIILCSWLYFAYGKKRRIKHEEAKFLEIYRKTALKHKKLSFDKFSIEQEDNYTDNDNIEALTVVCQT